MNTFYEYKSVKSAISDVDKKRRIVSGYGAVFENIDLTNDIIKRGAFTHSIKTNGPAASNKILFLAHHDPAQPLGKPSLLEERPKGLYHDSPVSNTSTGRDIMQLVEDQVLDSFSIGYSSMPAKTSYQQIGQKNIRVLHELKLHEISIVSIPANPEATLTGFKSQTKQGIAEQIERVGKAIRNGKYENDDTFLVLDIFHKQLQQALSETEKKENELSPAIMNLCRKHFPHLIQKESKNDDTLLLHLLRIKALL